MNFENKTIAVTGVASGIGAATAAELKSLGANVIGFDINFTNNNVDQFIPIDLTKSESIKKALEKCPSNLDALCNIAGVPPTVPPMVQMEVNFFGLREFTNLMMPKLSKGASIVNLASLAGRNYMEHIPQIKQVLNSETSESIEEMLKENNLYGESTYAFSKEVVILWTIKMAGIVKEKGFTIKALSPGPVNTPILKAFMETIVKKQALPPKGFEGEPTEIAKLVTFLCSENASWIHGRNIVADGGLSASRMSAGMGL